MTCPDCNLSCEEIQDLDGTQFHLEYRGKKRVAVFQCPGCGKLWDEYAVIQHQKMQERVNKIYEEEMQEEMAT